MQICKLPPSNLQIVLKKVHFFKTFFKKPIDKPQKRKYNKTSFPKDANFRQLWERFSNYSLISQKMNIQSTFYSKIG